MAFMTGKLKVKGDMGLAMRLQSIFLTMAATNHALGLGFELSEEQQALRELAHDFAEREIRPKEAAYDRESTYPHELVAKAHELGLMNLHVPESLGGLELGILESVLVMEELCWGCSGSVRRSPPTASGSGRSCWPATRTSIGATCGGPRPSRCCARSP